MIERIGWGGEDSNLRMAGSKSAALPLGYAPTASAGGESKQPGDCAEALELVTFARIKALLCRRRSSYDLAATLALARVSNDIRN